MNDKARERVDDALMNLRGGYGGASGLPGCIFVVPKACKSEHKKNDGDDTKAPGVYLLERREGGNTGEIEPAWKGRLLTREEALEWASAVDRLAKPHSSRHSSIVREGEFYPATWAELVTAWYEALGRRINRAVQESEDRTAALRETRAALTGRVGA